MFDSVSLAKSAKDTSLNIDILFLSGLFRLLSFLTEINSNRTKIFDEIIKDLRICYFHPWLFY